MRKLVLLVGLCMLGVLMLGSGASGQSAASMGFARDFDCSDVTYEEAQKILAGTDPSDEDLTMKLDADNDGVACEDNARVTGERASVSENQYDTATATATATAAATGGTAALPETGGISALSVAALGLLVAGGLLARRLVCS
jgi:LPXTG-motif cell wall-anchored protein